MGKRKKEKKDGALFDMEYVDEHIPHKRSPVRSKIRHRIIYTSAAYLREP